MSYNKGKSWGKCVLESPSLTLFSFFLIIRFLFFFFFETESEAAEKKERMCVESHQALL